MPPTHVDLAAIISVHARIPEPRAGDLPRGWEEAYRQDVGALLIEVEQLRAALAAARRLLDKCRRICAEAQPPLADDQTAVESVALLAAEFTVLRAERDEALAVLAGRPE